MSKTGFFLGFPYDWRRPTLARMKERYWNVADRRLYVPKVYGWGWTVNFYEAARRLGLTSRPTLARPAAPPRIPRRHAPQPAACSPTGGMRSALSVARFEMHELISWILVGLAAGWLANALTPGRTPGGFLGIIGVGVLGAVLGGRVWAALFGSGPSSFLGSVIVGVAGSMLILYLLSHARRSRYRL